MSLGWRGRTRAHVLSTFRVRWIDYFHERGRSGSAARRTAAVYSSAPPSGQGGAAHQRRLAHRLGVRFRSATRRGRALQQPSVGHREASLPKSVGCARRAEPTLSAATSKTQKGLWAARAPRAAVFAKSFRPMLYPARRTAEELTVPAFRRLLPGTGADFRPQSAQRWTSARRPSSPGQLAVLPMFHVLSFLPWSGRAGLCPPPCWRLRWQLAARPCAFDARLERHLRAQPRT